MGTTTASIKIGGTLDNMGTCKGIKYQENGRSWNDVVIIATAKITTKDYLARVTLETNEIHLQGDRTCKFTNGYCFDSMV